MLFTDRGLRYTLLAALFYAPSVVTIKWAMQCSDPYMGTLGGYLAASLLVTPIVLGTSRKHFAEVPRHWKAFVSFGLFAALTTVSQGTAYLMTLSSYVEAVKQVEILFAMGIGVMRLRGEAEGARHRAGRARDAGGRGAAVAGGLGAGGHRRYLGERLELRPLAVGDAHHGLDAAAHVPVPHDLHPARAGGRHEVVEDAVGHVLVEGALVPVRPHVELDRLELEHCWSGT